MDVIGWLLVIYANGTPIVLPTHYPSESVCIKSAEAAFIERGAFQPSIHGLGTFICIPGHSPLHGAEVK